MVNRTSRILGIIVLVLGLVVFSLKARAQKVVLKGTTFIEQTDSSHKRGEVKKTKYTYKSGDKIDTIYVSSKGSAFVLRTSKKTGKVYRKYLPEITKKLGLKHE